MKFKMIVGGSVPSELSERFTGNLPRLIRELRGYGVVVEVAHVTTENGHHDMAAHPDAQLDDTDERYDGDDIDKEPSAQTASDAGDPDISISVDTDAPARTDAFDPATGQTDLAAAAGLPVTAAYVSSRHASDVTTSLIPKRTTPPADATPPAPVSDSSSGDASAKA